MARDEDEDLYDEEFDFVDDDDDVEDAADDDDDADANEPINGEADPDEAAESDADEPVDEYGRPETPPANYVVHLYEHKKFTRTIDRPFTAEDAETFATEFNRTSKNYGRWAVSGKNDVKPKKALD